MTIYKTEIDTYRLKNSTNFVVLAETDYEAMLVKQFADYDDAKQFAEDYAKKSRAEFIEIRDITKKSDDSYRDGLMTDWFRCE
jgi:hypothetical protein